jgi:hypothetical protein
VCTAIGGGGKGCERNHLPSSNVEDKNEWSYTSTPSYAFTACKRENLSLTIVKKKIYIYLNKLGNECVAILSRSFPVVYLVEV